MLIRKNLNKGMTKIKIVRKIKDRCDKNRGCQETIKPRYKKINIADKKLKIVIKIKVFEKKLNKGMTKIEVG